MDILPILEMDDSYHIYENHKKAVHFLRYIPWPTEEMKWTDWLCDHFVSPSSELGVFCDIDTKDGTSILHLDLADWEFKLTIMEKKLAAAARVNPCAM
jgi:hypothetical protein